MLMRSFKIRLGGNGQCFICTSTYHRNQRWSNRICIDAGLMNYLWLAFDHKQTWSKNFITVSMLPQGIPDFSNDTFHTRLPSSTRT